MNTLYEKLGIHSSLDRYAASLPILQKYSLEEGKDGLKTHLEYAINGNSYQITLILTPPEPTPVVVQPSLENIASDIPHPFCLLVRKIIHFICTPFRWVYEYFVEYYQNEMGERNAFLDAILVHFCQPTCSEEWKKFDKIYKEKFNSFSVRWPFKSNELLSKQALIQGLFSTCNYINYNPEPFQKAIRLAPNDSLRLFAYAGMYSMYKKLCYDRENCCHSDGLNETLQKIRELEKTIPNIQSSFFTKVSSFSLKLFVLYFQCSFQNYASCEKNLLDLDDKITLLGNLGPIHSAIFEICFTNTMASLWNLVGHVTLLKQMCFDSEEVRQNDRESGIHDAASYFINALYLLNDHRKPEIFDDEGFSRFYRPDLKSDVSGNKKDATPLELLLINNLAEIDKLLNYSKETLKQLSSSNV